MSVDPAPIVTAPADEPLPNKAVAAFVGFLVTLVSQWLATGEFEFDSEGITAIAAVVVPAIVYWVSNRRKPKPIGETGQAALDLLVKVVVVVIIVAFAVWLLDRLL